ncbi:MAG: PrsW family glutamic-type intramembrane protease, partial [Minisyncoccia bacterium]
MPSFETIGYAVLGGIVPSFIWLYFLLREEAAHPEPKSLIAIAFCAGALAVPLVIPIEEAAKQHLALFGLAATSLPVLVSWALAEETLKYLMAALFILWRRAVDKAPDYVIYLVTVALGFAAAENALFLLSPLSSGQFLLGFETDNLRFIGSTLLHVVASAAIGFSLAFSWKKSSLARIAYAASGLILAVALHAAFNALIISGEGSAALSAFFLVWSATVVFFALFEVLKYFQYRKV